MNCSHFPRLLPLGLLMVVVLTGCQGRQQYEIRETSGDGGARVQPGAVASYAEVVDRVTPAVVTIRSERRVRAPRQFPFFFPFFGPSNERSPGNQTPFEVQRGLGSGVIVSPDGLCLTNHHVVDGAEQIRIELKDGRTFDAKLVGSDPPSDLAVLRLDAKDLPVLTLGNSDAMRVGDVVLAVGNPLGVGQTVTSGIISAKGRSTGLSDGSFEDFLQTDAAINRGNSGGALVNTRGELVGINSQILSPTGGFIGIGFAIPIKMARNVMEQLVKTGHVRRGRIGVAIQPLTSDLAQGLGVKDRKGVVVSSVESKGPADRAGLRAGDVITAINGEAVEDPNSLRNRIASTQPGTELSVTYIREGKENQTKIKLGEFDEKKAANRQPQEEEGDSEDSGAKLGISVQPLTPALARQLGIENVRSGLVITDIDPAGPAAEAGLSAGDVIVQVSRKPVRSVEDIRSALGQSGEGPVLLLINRKGQNLFVTVRPAPKR